VSSDFLFTFGAVAHHIQDEAEAQRQTHQTSAYYPHTDKFGLVAMFLQSHLMKRATIGFVINSGKLMPPQRIHLR
jgi:hypothetical protein